MKSVCRFAFIVAIVLSMRSFAFAIGCGGVLNEVPQAHVKIGGVEMPGWKVYVHPTEGALLAVPPEASGDADTIALDRWLSRAISVKRSDLVFRDRTAEATSDVPYVLLKEKPKFEQYSASLRLDDGRMLMIYVER